MKSSALCQLITASRLLSCAEITRISSLCGRHIIGTMPLEIAPVFTHTLSGQSAETTAIAPFSTFIVFVPCSVLIVNSQSCDSVAVRKSLPSTYISAIGSAAPMFFIMIKAAIPAIQINVSAATAIIYLLFIFTSDIA